MNRLANAKSSGAILYGCQETYDAWGNRTAQAPYGGTGYSCTAPTTPVTAGNNRLSGYTYDVAGNLLNDGSNTLTYDADGRIATSYSPIFGVTSSYIYDAGGQRVSKIFGSYETDYVHDPGGALLATYVNGSYFGNFQDMWIGGKHFGEVVVAAGNASQTQNFSLTNWVGSQAAYTNPSTGIPTAAYLSQPFGDAQTTLFGSNNDDIHFTGKERDGESGNDYFGARYYASTMGRWMSPDKPFADQHASNPQSWNLYEYGRDNPLRNVDPNGQKVLQAVVAEAVSKINSLPGGTLYLDFAGIQGLHTHQSLGPWGNFDLWHSDHTAANSVIIPNSGIVSGFLRALFGLANKDQVDTGNAIVAAAKKSGQDIAIDTYSNGINAAGQVAQGLSSGDLQSATVVAPNTGSPAAVQALDQADGDSTLIFMSTLDPALNFAFLGSMTFGDWDEAFPGRVFDTGQASHNLNRYHQAVSGSGEIQSEMQRQCALGNPAACN